MPAARRGRPSGPSRNRPYKEAIQLECFSPSDESVHKRSLRGLARALLDKAADGDIAAIKEVGDRLDGKAIQVIAGDEEQPLRIETVKRIIVRPGSQDKDG